MRRLALLLCGLLAGCASLDYYSQLGRGQLALLGARQPVSALLADPASPPRLHQQLALVQQAGQFASETLQLPGERSYRQYVALDRRYVLWNLFATPELSLQPIEHCFPIAGCVAYRGYFEQGRARGAAALLQARGLDTLVAGVEAYSTLGWLDDPLLSSMLQRSDAQLVALIIHERAHQQLYLPGDSSFSESFAHFVERQGLCQWRRNQQLPAEDAAEQRSERMQRQFSALILDSRARLQALYQSPQSDAAKRAGKQAEFERLRQRYRQLRDRQWQGDRRYDAWIAAPLNNARLLPFGLYDQHLPAFAALFQQSGGDWPQFYRSAAELARLPHAERQQTLARLHLKDAAADPMFSTPAPCPE